MQARYYDPVIGRFYSNDPVGYVMRNPIHSFNRYAYASNNPFKYIDPDGKEVIVAPDLQKDYDAAKKYLTSKSSLAKGYFARLERKSSPTVRINSTEGGSSAIIKNSTVKLDEIKWNPKEGLVTSSGGQSPATGLIHEIIHVQNHQSGITVDPMEDKLTITKENAVNNQTGEVTRKDHADGKVQEVSGPTCRPSGKGESCG